MDSILVRKPTKEAIGAISLAGSKSISNRVLIIRALCAQDFKVTHLANAKDTETLLALLDQSEGIYDAGPAGTTYRFMTAYLALQEGRQVLTGSERMKERPIGVLVDALRSLGADIEYLEKEGYPPLAINSPKEMGDNNQLTIAASTSSQYISALLMIAPTLPNGLELSLEGKVVSRPYIQMTLNLMAYFGVQYDWEGNTIRIKAQTYQAKDFQVEADWSAASYYYAIAAFAEKVDLQLNGLFAESVQGDAVIAEMMTQFGIVTTFNENGLHLSKTEHSRRSFEWDFLECPDIAQTLAVICGGLGMMGLFTGLETLKIKETDRILALQNELQKTQVFLSKMPARFTKDASKTFYMTEGKAVVEEVPTFATYHDHRMAMAFAPLAFYGEIKIEDPSVVEKSYPDFWKDLERLGFELG